MRHVLALDQGTTSSRAIIFDESGKAVASAQKEFKQFYPEPGWVEHDPDEIWRSQREVAREALKASPTSARRRSCGTGRPACRCTRRSSGRTGAPRRCAPN
jgi:glycerol kinase